MLFADRDAARLEHRKHSFGIALGLTFSFALCSMLLAKADVNSMYCGIMKHVRRSAA